MTMKSKLSMIYWRITMMTIRILIIIISMITLWWISTHPEIIGQWYAKFQKGQIQEFNKR